jgi:hypothetical protein
MRTKGELTGSYSLQVLVISEWDSVRSAVGAAAESKNGLGMSLRSLVGRDSAVPTAFDWFIAERQRDLARAHLSVSSDPRG